MVSSKRVLFFSFLKSRFSGAWVFGVQGLEESQGIQGEERERWSRRCAGGVWLACFCFLSFVPTPLRFVSNSTFGLGFEDCSFLWTPSGVTLALLFLCLQSDPIRHSLFRTCMRIAQFFMKTACLHLSILQTAFLCSPVATPDKHRIDTGRSISNLRTPSPRAARHTRN